MEAPAWSDVYTADEWAIVLEAHSTLLAKRFGAYSVAADLAMAADCIRDLSERLVMAESLAIQVKAMQQAIAEKTRTALSIVESLSKAP